MKTTLIVFTCLIAIVFARNVIHYDEHDNLHVPEHIPVEFEHVKLESKVESKIGDKKIEIAVLVPSTLKPYTGNPITEQSEKTFSAPKKWRTATASRTSKQQSEQFDEKLGNTEENVEENPEHHGLHDEARRNGRHYHDMKIVQLESDIEENGKYHYG